MTAGRERVDPPALDAAELVRLIETVFEPRTEDRTLVLLVDLPDERLPDNEAWAARRAIAADWCRKLRGAASRQFDRIDLIGYRNVRRNNAELPARATVLTDLEQLPVHANDVEARSESFAEILGRYRILMAPTELSATAPLKLYARQLGFRAATMPGFAPAMTDALRLDYEEIAGRCAALKSRLDPAEGAQLVFEAGGASFELHLDLRHRTSIASGGRITAPGTAGNLPSGETYIVPYEGERPGDPSRSAGMLPLDLEGEIVVHRIERNRSVEVSGSGPRAAEERAEIERERAYGNLAELGLGVLAAFGVHAIGEMLLDEKLGLHIAFGRSDHFGGAVGPADFNAADGVIHLDRVFIPEVQPRVVVRSVDLVRGSEVDPLMRDGSYVGDS